jgi:hypothetical protein
MIEAEIAKLTAAVEALTRVLKDVMPPPMVTLTGGYQGSVINLEDLLVRERANREDDAYREKLQRERDETRRKEEPKTAKTKRTKVTEPAQEPAQEPSEKIAEKIAEPGELNPPDAAAPDAAPEAKPSTSKENLKDMALAISRADSSSNPEIIAILASHGAKTITALPDNQSVLFDVFVRLNSLSAKIAGQSK